MKKYLFILGLAVSLMAGCGRSNSYTKVEYVEPENVASVEEILPEPETNDRSEPEICVSILGEVLTPGVYILPEGSRVYEAINMAGGLTDDAYVDGISLASILEDEMQIIVPSFEEDITPINDATIDGGKAKDGKVNLNTASLAELMTLPGIGEVRAQAIIDFREKNGKFSSIEDVMKVSGIKESSFEKMQDSICVK